MQGCSRHCNERSGPPPRFESKSQHSAGKEDSATSCSRHCNERILKANHNAGLSLPLERLVVLDIAMNGAGRRRGLKANHNTVLVRKIAPRVVLDIAMNGF